MTFKEYLKTPEAKKKIKAIIKKKKLNALPQCKTSRHFDSSDMGPTNYLPAAADSSNQPGLS
jgi:hypothetical protein